MFQEAIPAQALPAQRVIEAERFVLRPLRKSDAGLMTMYTSDKRVAEGTRAIPHPLPPGASEQFISRILSGQGDEDVWAIDGSGHGSSELLGVVSLTRLAEGQSEVGFWLGAGFWNAGYASEAVQALVAANPHEARTLLAEVFQDNPGSGRVVTNAGFQYLGDAESWSVARNASVPTWTYLKKMG